MTRFPFEDNAAHPRGKIAVGGPTATRPFVRSWSVSVFLVMFETVVAPPASAYADTRGDEQVARKLYEEGKSAFDAGNYEPAYQAFRQAYLLSQKAELLFNMAAALKKLGRPHDSAEALRAYLRVRPDADGASSFEEQIRALEEQQRIVDEDRRQRAAAEPPSAESPAAATRPDPAAVIRAEHHAHRLRLAGIAATAVGAASLVGGAIFVGLAKAANDDIDHAHVFNPSTEDRRNAYERADAVLFGLGGAAVVAGVTLLAVGHRESRVRVAPWVGIGSAGAAVRVAF